MKVLGLMCDGQYRDMQDFIRAQNEEIREINLVEEILSFVQTFHQNQHLDGSMIKLLHRILQTLIETSIGNHANLQVIFNTQILSVLNYILQLDLTNIKRPSVRNAQSFLGLHHTDENEMSLVDQNEPQKMTAVEYKELRKQALELKSSAIELLEGTLEETSSKTRELVNRLAGGLDIEALHGTMVDFCMLKSDVDLRKEEYDDNAERGMYRTYHILMQLEYYGVPGIVLGRQIFILKPEVLTLLYSRVNYHKHISAYTATVN